MRVAFFSDNGIVTPAAETAAVERVANALGGGRGVPAVVSLVDESRPAAVPRTMDVFGRLWSTYAPGWRAKLLQRAGTPPDAGKSEPDQDDDRGPAARLALADLDEVVAAYRSDMLAFIEHYDAIVCPVCAYPALHHGGSGERGSAFAYTMAFNFTGWPVVVVRAGTSPEGLPIGIQIVARPWHEHVALDPASMTVDPYLVAAKMTEDAVLAYHTALEFHGRAYSVHWRLVYVSVSKSLPLTFQSHEFRGAPVPPPLLARGQEMFGVTGHNRSGVQLRVTDPGARGHAGGPSQDRAGGPCGVFP